MNYCELLHGYRPAMLLLLLRSRPQHLEADFQFHVQLAREVHVTKQ
jgi:hypothetical protein